MGFKKFFSYFALRSFSKLSFFSILEVDLVKRVCSCDCVNLDNSNLCFSSSKSLIFLLNSDSLSSTDLINSLALDSFSKITFSSRSNFFLCNNLKNCSFSLLKFNNDNSYSNLSFKNCSCSLSYNSFAFLYFVFGVAILRFSDFNSSYCNSIFS